MMVDGYQINTLFESHLKKMTPWWSETKWFQWRKDFKIKHTPSNIAKFKLAGRFIASGIDDSDTLLKGYLKGIDFSKSVNCVTLKRKTKLIAYRRKNEPFYKMFYTTPNTKASEIGLSDTGRVKMNFEINADAIALFSYASSIVDHWTCENEIVFCPGGSTQFMCHKSENWVLKK